MIYDYQTYLVRDNIDNGRGNLLLSDYGLHFWISGKVLLYVTSHIQWHCYIPVVEHWVEREIPPWGIDPTTQFTMVGYSTTELWTNFRAGGVNNHWVVNICVLSCVMSYYIKEGNVFFNNVFNTFYLRLYGIGHMVNTGVGSGGGGGGGGMGAGGHVPPTFLTGGGNSMFVPLHF